MKKTYNFILLIAFSVFITTGGNSQQRTSHSNMVQGVSSQSKDSRSTSYPISKKSLFTSNNNSNQNMLTYCEPSFNSCDLDFIEKVIFAGINNDSECDSGYSDYTDQVGLALRGDTQTISVRTNSASSQNVFLFIDWNQDGVLDDTGEVYTIASNVHNNGPHIKEITIPQDAVLGETRMRVILQWNNTNPDPCIVYGNGEAEDYTLNVVDEIPNLPEACSQWIPSSWNSNGYFFMGETNQRLAIDIDVLPESSFELESIVIQTLDQASFFNLVFYDNEDDLPGTPFLTLNDISIIDEEFIGAGSDYEYYRYTLDVSSENLLFEGQQDGKKIWMEVLTDATGWNNTEHAVLGSLAVYTSDLLDDWGLTDSELVYELIGVCNGEQIQDIPNNACSDAIPIACGNVVNGTTVGADDFGGNLSPDVFYSYTGNGQQENISLSLCAGTKFDTVIRVFTDCSLSNEIAFDDNFCGVQSVVNFISDGVSTYYIMIEGSYTNDLGDFSLYASCQELPPSNDTPSQGIALECGDRVQGSTVNASNTAGNPAGDVFYTYNGNGAEEDITVSLCSIFTSYDTEIRVYDNAGLTNLVASADDSCGLFSEVTFYSDGVKTYYIMIEGSESEEGNYDLRLSCWDYTPYCSPLSFVFIEPITNVEIADISNRSSEDPTSPPHEVFTDIIGNLHRGETYDITLEGFTGSDGEWENFFTVFIDWNQNDILNDVNEMYEIGSIFNSTGTDGQQLIGSITVPENALLGETVMRVIKAYPSSPYDPCANYNWGQVEDYTINVLDLLGAEDYTENKIRYYPNPVENIMNIESDLLLTEVIVYDVFGKVVFETTPGASIVQMDLSFLSSGIYLAKVVADQEVQTIKIIKN